MKRIVFCVVSALLVLFVSVTMAATACAETLSIVHVNAPAINCKFDPSCKVVVTDVVTNFAWSSSSNDSFLQSRTWPAGQPGTAAAGLYAYIYRIDLSKAMAATGYTCVVSFSIPFGQVEALDYSGSGTANHVFVITSGGMGSIAPVTAEKTGNKIDFTFQQPFCNGGQPDKGGMTFFFGMSSKNSSRSATATLARDIGPALNLKAVAPKLPIWKNSMKEEMNRPIRVRN